MSQETSDMKTGVCFVLEFVDILSMSAVYDGSGNATDSLGDNTSVYIEASWEGYSKNYPQVAVQAGESVTFVCRIWHAVTSGPTYISSTDSENEHYFDSSSQNRLAVFLYCPLSLAYCSQDCLLVDSRWPITCTRQFRSIPHSHGPSQLLLSADRIKRWDVQEIIYTIKLAVVNSGGPWSCSYGGSHSKALRLSVRDRPVLLSLSSNPKSPVRAGTSVNLTCTAAPSPNSPWYDFLWGRVGSRIPPAHSTIRLSHTESVLTLLSVEPTDDGLYSCQVQRNTDNPGTNWWNAGGSDRNRRVMGEGMDGIATKVANPALLQLYLEVHHPPESLTFEVSPPGSHRAGSTVTLRCLVKGGKPEPKIYFYRIQDQAEVTNGPLNVEYFNASKHEGNDEISGSEKQLPWILSEKDNRVRFGCAAVSPVLDGRMLSPSVELSVLFPPGPPILTATPQSAVIENRTRIFTCTSSKGSNPVAKVKWRLLAAVDYVTGSSDDSYSLVKSVDEFGKPSVVSETASAFGSVDISDFDTDTAATRWSATVDRDVKIDQSNRGLIVHSQARLVSRPWFNGARVSCQLEWHPVTLPKSSGSKRNPNITKNIASNETTRSYMVPAYLTTEVFFSPVVVSISANPRNGIQEGTGSQILECTTTSAHPPAEITWLRRSFSPTFSRKYTSKDKNYAVLEDPLQTWENDTVITKWVTSETLPGIYGGKRVISRLHLMNATREQDGTLYICKVTHVEWVKNVGRTHQLVVLYPPKLKVRAIPEDWKDRKSSPKTTLECVPNGGRPPFPDMREWLSFKNFTTNRTTKWTESKLQSSRPYGMLFADANIWEFTWSFKPTYSENLNLHEPDLPQPEAHRSRELVENTGLTGSPTLVLNKPGRKEVGEYTCSLAGPGGTVRSSISMQFMFPPELVPPGITVLTSPVGFQAIIELYIWAFPSPLPENSMVEGYSTPSGLSSCLRARSMAAVKLLAKNSEHTYSWYKVKTAGKPPNVKVHSRQRVSGISGGEIFQNYNNDPTSGGPRTNKQSGAPHVWSDVILINLASVYSRQLYRQALQGNKSAQINRDRIPTIVYRLFFDVVQEKDYGEYMCEIDHISGRKNFLVRLQPPVVAGESNRPVQFSRQGSTVHLYFDPSIMKSPQDSRDLETTGTVFSLTGNIASKTSPGEQATRTPRKRGNFTWLLLRVCALSEKSNRNDTNGEEIFSCDENKGGPGSFNTESVFFGLRALPETIYGRAIRQDSCIDRVIENPEKGSAVIKLDDYADSWFVHSSRPRSLPSLTARSQPEGIGNDEASLKRETDRFWSTRSINDPEESSSSALVQSSSLSWRQVEKVVYQLRFYDSHGSLDHTTDWFIENDASQTPNRQDGTSKLGPILWILLASLLASVLLVMGLIFMLRKRRRGKREIPVIVDQGCLSLKNPLGGAKDDFFQASCPKQESYYIGNASVIDSPCPVSGARGFTGKHLLLKPLSHPIDSPTDGFGLPVDAIQLLPSNMCKSIPVCMNEGKANSPNDDYQSHLWRIYRQNAKQSSGDESDSLILSRELVQLYENKNSSALKLIPDEQRNENRSNSSAAYSSSTLSQLSPWSQMRSNDGNIQSSGPLQIYNKCYNPHEDSPLDNGPQPLCGTPSMPAVCKGFTRPSKLFQNIEAGLFSEGYNPTAIPPQAPLYRPHIHRSPKSTRGQQNGGEFSNWPTYLVGTSPFPSISTSRPTCATQVLQRRVTPTGKEFRFAYDTGSLKAPGCTLPNAFSLGSGEKIRTEKPGNSAALSKVDTVPSIITPDVLNAQEICGLETFQRKRQAPDENLSRVHSAGLNENVHVQKTFTVPGPKELGYIIQNTCISEKDHTVPQSSQNCLIAHKETAS